MRIVVIAGQARKVGKTSVMTGLIRATRQLNWTAVKISTHQGSALHAGGTVGSQGKRDLPFTLAEEKKPSPFTDTGRYLAAGARRAFWLQVKSDCLDEAIAALIDALGNKENILIESGSVLSVLKPEVAILVLNRSRREVKPNFRRALARADAVVEISSARTGTASLPRLPSGMRQFSSAVRRFTVTRKDYFSSGLCRFVRRKLRSKAV